MGSNPVEAPVFYGHLLSSCLSCKIYYNDHSSLSPMIEVSFFFQAHVYLCSNSSWYVVVVFFDM